MFPCLFGPVSLTRFYWLSQHTLHSAIGIFLFYFILLERWELPREAIVMIVTLEKTCQFISAWATLSRGASYLAELKEHGTQRDKVDGGEDPTGHCAGLSVLL